MFDPAADQPLATTFEQVTAIGDDRPTWRNHSIDMVNRFENPHTRAMGQQDGILTAMKCTTRWQFEYFLTLLAEQKKGF